MAATKSRKPGPGRPKGLRNRRTDEIDGTLDAAHVQVTRALLNEVVPDRQLVQLLWKLALEGDGRVATYLADRKWGRTKLELETGGGTFILLLGPPGAGLSMQDFEYRPDARIAGTETRALPPASHPEPDP
jgi:hypothetical protein